MNSLHKTYKGLITELKANQIFVFGANTESRHGAGAALVAKNKFGAINGSKKKGLEGQSYAIITKDLTKSHHPSISKEYINDQIKTLYDFAKENLNLEFFIAYSGNGTNLNGYSNKEMASMFCSHEIPLNIVFEDNFYELIVHILKLKNKNVV